MFWILYRDLIHKERVLFETDDLQIATILLQSVADTASQAQLIDFSGELDGVLDHLLDGVKLFTDALAV